MQPVKVERFAGINNRQPIDRIRNTDAGMPVRDALNVDLSASGTFQHRPGYAQVLAAQGARCLHEIANGALFAAGDRLYRFDGENSTEIATLASAFAHVAYTDTPLGTVWSDGFRVNVYNGTSRLLSPPAPNPEPSVTAASGGALPAGTYGVMFCTINAAGQQSAPTYPSYVTVPQGGVIQVAVSGHTERIAVFISALDSEVFYREGTIEVGQTSALFPFARAQGQPRVYEVLADIPAGRELALHKGRLFSVVGPMVFYSQPWDMGLYRPADGFIPMAENITLVASVEGGAYIATLSETWWFPGGDISKADAVRLLPYGAVRGTLSKMPNSTDLMWFTPRGPVRASQGGEVVALQDAQVAFPTADAGASIWRESNGLRQLISAITSNPRIPPGAAVAGTYMEAEVIQP